MPLYPPRDLEPYKKRESLEKREHQLMHALKSGFETYKINRAAENVRAAQLAVLKARFELIRYQPETEQQVNQLLSIEQDKTRWSNISAEDIALEYMQRLDSFRVNTDAVN